MDVAPTTENDGHQGYIRRLGFNHQEFLSLCRLKNCTMTNLAGSKPQVKQEEGNEEEKNRIVSDGKEENSVNFFDTTINLPFDEKAVKMGN